MKFLDEYKDPEKVKAICLKIRDVISNDWKIMEVCGGQTHTILKYNLEELLPNNISLIHGPGCPVCVTPVEMIDKAVYLSGLDDVILVSYGDMLRVPGTYSDLLTCKAKGSDIRMVYSPQQIIKIAKENKNKKVIFFSVGFETTAPANALSIINAQKENITNYFMLCSHVTVPSAIDMLLSNNSAEVNGFLLPGHVCTVMGYTEYLQIAEKYKVPCVVTGFEIGDILAGIYLLVKQLEEGRYDVENQYSRIVRKEGNRKAILVIDEIFTRCDQIWRGIGNIPQSGLRISDKYSDFDAEIAFKLNDINIEEKINARFNKKILNKDYYCIAGNILQGISKPLDCIYFGSECTPEHPLGAPMVSFEGACSAYYSYRKK